MNGDVDDFDLSSGNNNAVSNNNYVLSTQVIWNDLTFFTTLTNSLLIIKVDKFFLNIATYLQRTD